MQDNVILKKIIQIISKIIGVNECELNINSDIKNTPNWDSFNHVALVIKICDDFSIEFSQDAILEFTSIRKIYNYIKKEKKMIEKISSMAIVIAKSNEGKKILQLNNEGEWVFPKGHVENGETYLDAAIRELKDESGVLVTPNECIGQVDEFKFYFNGEKAVKVIKVFAFVIENVREINFNRAEGFVDGAWFDVTNAINQLKHDDARNALKKALGEI